IRGRALSRPQPGHLRLQPRRPRLEILRRTHPSGVEPLLDQFLNLPRQLAVGGVGGEALLSVLGEVQLRLPQAPRRFGQPVQGAPARPRNRPGGPPAPPSAGRDALVVVFGSFPSFSGRSPPRGPAPAAPPPPAAPRPTPPAALASTWPVSTVQSPGVPTWPR